MRNLLLVILGAAACGAQTHINTIPSYTCGHDVVVRSGDTLRADGGKAATLGWHDGEGAHFVAWPVAPTERRAVEIVLPDDPRKDATQRVYDTSMGSSHADWRLVDREACTARGGYTDVLARYVRGETLDELAHELALGDRDKARDLVHDAMMQVQRRYFHDH